MMLLPVSPEPHNNGMKLTVERRLVAHFGLLERPPAAYAERSASA